MVMSFNHQIPRIAVHFMIHALLSHVEDQPLCIAQAALEVSLWCVDAQMMLRTEEGRIEVAVASVMDGCCWNQPCRQPRLVPHKALSQAGVPHWVPVRNALVSAFVVADNRH